MSSVNFEVKFTEEQLQRMTATVEKIAREAASFWPPENPDGMRLAVRVPTYQPVDEPPVIEISIPIAFAGRGVGQGAVVDAILAAHPCREIRVRMFDVLVVAKDSEPDRDALANRLAEVAWAAFDEAVRR